MSISKIKKTRDGAKVKALDSVNQYLKKKKKKIVSATWKLRQKVCKFQASLDSLVLKTERLEYSSVVKYTWLTPQQS